MTVDPEPAGHATCSRHPFGRLPRRIHGDDDQIVPIGASGLASAKLVKNSKLIVYPGAPHGLTDTHKDKFNADLLAFVQS